MRFDLDTEIRYPTGERAGVLRRVVVDEQNRVHEIVMATEGFVSRRALVPVSALSEAPGNVLTINMTPDEIDDLPDYEEERMPAVTGDWEFPQGAAPGADVFPATLLEPIMPVMEVSNLMEGELSLSQGTEVWCLDGRWGVVDEVLTGDDDQVYAFIGRSDEADELDRVIPVDLIQEEGPSQVTLNCTLNDLATYTQEITGEAEEPEL